jgi:hypothetical protein
VDVPALPATVGWHRQALALAASRYDWPR